MRTCSGQHTTCCDRGGLAWLGGAIATRSSRGTIGYSLLRLCSSRSNATAGCCRLRSLGSLLPTEIAGIAGIADRRLWRAAPSGLVNRQPCTKRQCVCCNVRRAACNMQQATCNAQRLACNLRRATDHMRYATGSMRCTPCCSQRTWQGAGARCGERGAEDGAALQLREGLHTSRRLALCAAWCHTLCHTWCNTLCCVTTPLQHHESVVLCWRTATSNHNGNRNHEDDKAISDY
jgi:hypothetical protein